MLPGRKLPKTHFSLNGAHIPVANCQRNRTAVVMVLNVIVTDKCYTRKCFGNERLEVFILTN